MITPAYSPTATERVLPRMALDFTTGVLDPRVTFTRGSNATLVDGTGKLTYAPANLFLQSQTFETASWNKNNATVTADATTAPDGTSTADALADTASSSSHFISQSVALSAVQTVIISLYAKANTLSRFLVRENSITGAFVSFDLSSGTILATSGSVTGSITSVGNGWYRCAIVQGIGTTGATSYGVFTLPAGGSTFANATYVGTGQSIYVWGAQSEIVTYQTAPSTYVATTTAAYYGPRFDYDPVTLAPKGLLIEEARTNLLLRSEEFDNASWTKSAVTVTANAAISPDGTTNADSVIEDTATSDHRVNQGAISLGAGQNTLSCFIKAGSRTFARIQFDGTVGGVASSAGVNVNLSTGALGTVAVVGNITSGTATATAFGNGWYRVTLTATLSVAVTGASTRIFILQSIGGSTSYTGNGTGNILLYGAQLEAGAFATSYIPTTTTSLTRNADAVSMTGTNFTSWYNASEGAFLAKFSFPTIPAAQFRYVLSANDGTATNFIAIAGNTTSNVPAGRVIASSSTQASMGGGSIVANQQAIGVLAYKLDSFAYGQNGATIGTDATGLVPTVNRLDIGALTTSYACCHIQRVAYWPQRIINNETLAFSK